MRKQLEELLLPPSLTTLVTEDKNSPDHDYLLVQKRQELELVFAALSMTFIELIKNETMPPELFSPYLSLMIQVAKRLERIYARLMTMPNQGQKWHGEVDKLSQLKKNIDDLNHGLTPIMDLPNDNTKEHRGFFINIVRFSKQFLTSIKQFFISFYHSPVQSIKNLVRDTNWWRLFFARSKRFINALNDIVKSSFSLRTVSDYLNKLNVTLSYLSFIWYLPRFMLDTAMLSKHLFAIKITNDEFQLGWYRRLKIQLDELWFTLTNDSLWIGIGVASAFFLSMPVAAAVSVTGFGIDIFLAGIRLYQYQKNNILLQNLDDKIKVLTKQCENLQHHDPEWAKKNVDLKLLETQRKSMQAQLAYDKNQLKLSLAVTIALFAGVVCTSIAVFTPIGPILPFIGAVIILSTCFAQYYCCRKLNQTAPAKTLNACEMNSTLLCRNLKIEPKKVSSPIVQHDIKRLTQVTQPIAIPSASLTPDDHVAHASFIAKSTSPLPCGLFSQSSPDDPNQNPISAVPVPQKA